MAKGKYSPDELGQLATQVVDQILNDDKLFDALVGIIEKKRPETPECPPRTLCCSKNHVCEVHTVAFSCTAPFQCSNGHTEKLIGT
jgi:hypothetical protein